MTIDECCGKLYLKLRRIDGILLNECMLPEKEACRCPYYLFKKITEFEIHYCRYEEANYKPKEK